MYGTRVHFCCPYDGLSPSTFYPWHTPRGAAVSYRHSTATGEAQRLERCSCRMNLHLDWTAFRNPPSKSDLVLVCEFTCCNVLSNLNRVKLVSPAILHTGFFTHRVQEHFSGNSPYEDFRGCCWHTVRDEWASYAYIKWKWHTSCLLYN